jgi:hypothetical protein
LKTGGFYRGVIARLVRSCRPIMSVPHLHRMPGLSARAAGRWPLVAQAKR